MSIALILLVAVLAVAVYHANVVALVLSLPDSNDDFVFTGEAGGDCPDRTVPSYLPGFADKKAGDGRLHGQSEKSRVS